MLCELIVQVVHKPKFMNIKCSFENTLFIEEIQKVARELSSALFRVCSVICK